MKATALVKYSYCAGVLLLTYVVFLSTGTMGITWWENPRYFFPTPPTIEAVQFSSGSEASVDVLNTEVYRANFERDGYFPVERSLDLEVARISSAPNVGIHSASKASALAVEEDVIIATDHGLLARVTASGDFLWRFRTHDARQGFHATPLVWKDLVIAGDYSGLFFALDAQSGKLRWSIQLGNSIGASPLITPDGKILVSVETSDPDGYLAKLDARTGQLHWFSRWFNEHSHSSPALHWDQKNPQQSLVLLGDNAGYMNGINYDTGDRIWRFRTEGPIKATPAVWEGRIYFPSWDKYLYALNIKNGNLYWKRPTSAFNQSSVAILAEKQWGYFSTRNGLCRFHLLKEHPDYLCDTRDKLDRNYISSPTITRSASGGSALKHIVWSPCGTNRLCAYSTQMELLKEWVLKSPVSGEIRPAHPGMIAQSEGEEGLIWLR